MNWIDWLLALVLIASVIDGFWKGFSRQVIGLAAVVAGLLGGIWFYSVAAAWYIPVLKSEALARFLGFLTIFVGVQVVGGLIGWMVSKFLKTVGLSWLDRLMGGAFGFIKAGLIAVALVLALTAFPFQPVKDSVARSQVAPYVLEIAGVLASLAPQELKDEFRKGYEDVRQLWDKVPQKT